MKIVIELKGGSIAGIITDEPAEVLVLDHDLPIPGIDEEPKETVIGYGGSEIVCEEIEAVVKPLNIAYFFGMHEVQNELQYL